MDGTTPPDVAALSEADSSSQEPSEPKYLFVGFLANTDDSILALKSLGGCRIHKLNPESAFRIVSRFRPAEEYDTAKFLTYDTSCMLNRDSPAYVLVRNLRVARDISPPGELPVNELLVEEIRLVKKFETLCAGLRIFNRGNIQVPFHVLLSLQDERVERVTLGMEMDHVTRDPFVVREDQIPGLKEWIQSFRLPLEPDYLDLAFCQFEAAYKFDRKDIRFTLLWTGMEVLFHGGRSNVGTHVANRASALLLPEGHERRRLHARLWELFELRSDVVHRGAAKRVKEEHVGELTGLLQGCLKRCVELRLPKAALNAKLAAGHLSPATP